jgi:glycosyltransferase involved in cell wall biosynthesis
MKIAVWHNLPSGGGKRALYYHVRGLVARGHAVEAWCPPTSDRDYLPLGEFVTENVVPLDIRQSRVRTFLAGREMLRDQLHSNLLAQVEALDEHCRKCAEEINRGGFDILFANSSLIQAVSSIGRYVETAKALYLQEPHRGLYEARGNGLPWVAIPAIKTPWIRPRYLSWFMANLIGTQQLRQVAREELLNARAFDRILVNSFFSRESLLRAYGLDSAVCYLGVDNQLFVNRHQSREGFVVGLGELGPHKNVEFIIRAVAEIFAPRPRLIWIGNVSHQFYSEEMQRLAKSADVSLESRTRISDSELVEMLNRASVMAYAPRLEPFGFAPLEANSCGLPVVAVAEGGVRETMVDGVNGLLVDAEPRAMGKGIEQLLKNREYARQLGETGFRMVAEKWSWDAALDRLEQQFVRTIEQRSKKGTTQ